MELLTIIIQSLAVVAGIISALASILFFVPLHWPAPGRWFAKLYASALSPFIVLTAVFTTVVGLLTGSIFISLLGIYNLAVYTIHIYCVTRQPAAACRFETIFGEDWQSKIDAGIKKQFLTRRTILKLPGVTEPHLEQDLCYATIPGTNRKLLCDIWQPAPTSPRSGLTFIYLHGSAFYFLDKDFQTRPLFRHLASQGHVIMDIAYRLAPETDLLGMVNDTQRAILWMKKNAAIYGVDPACIALGGGSAGGHISLLTAYTVNDPRFIPHDLETKDLGVRAVISLYGTTDLEAIYYHTNQHLTSRDIPGKKKKPVPEKMPGWVVKKLGKEYHRLGIDKDFKNTGALVPLMGGHPDECPEKYALYSPVNHIHPGCPPTLLVHDKDDIMAPVKTTQLLFDRLTEKRIPAILHLIPQTDHAFDLILPKISPAAHNLIYDVERFLGLMASAGTKQTKTKETDHQLCKANTESKLDLSIIPG